MKRITTCIFLLVHTLSGLAFTQSPCAIFYDGFESGVLGQHWQCSFSDPINVNDAVVTTNPAFGNYAYQPTRP